MFRQFYQNENGQSRLIKQSINKFKQIRGKRKCIAVIFAKKVIYMIA